MHGLAVIVLVLDIFIGPRGDKDCVLYNIDCGCAYHETYPTANLACIRIDDEVVFYLHE